MQQGPICTKGDRHYIIATLAILLVATCAFVIDIKTAGIASSITVFKRIGISRFSLRIKEVAQGTWGQWKYGIVTPYSVLITSSAAVPFFRSRVPRVIH